MVKAELSFKMRAEHYRLEILLYLELNTGYLGDI